MKTDIKHCIRLPGLRCRWFQVPPTCKKIKIEIVIVVCQNEQHYTSVTHAHSEVYGASCICLSVCLCIIAPFDGCSAIATKGFKGYKMSFPTF